MLFDPNDLEVIDNGEIAESVVIDCPPDVEEAPFFAVLVNDRSGSMMWPTASGKQRIELLKSGVKEFIAGIPSVPPTAIARTAFDGDALVLTAFQTSPPPLINAIDRITPDGGTEYDPPFLDQFAGAIGMLESLPAGPRRIIVFLTDGHPNSRPDIASIIAR